MVSFFQITFHIGLAQIIVKIILNINLFNSIFLFLVCNINMLIDNYIYKMKDFALKQAFGIPTQIHCQEISVTLQKVEACDMFEDAILE